MNEKNLALLLSSFEIIRDGVYMFSLLKDSDKVWTEEELAEAVSKMKADFTKEKFFWDKVYAKNKGQ